MDINGSRWSHHPGSCPRSCPSGLVGCTFTCPGLPLSSWDPLPHSPTFSAQPGSHVSSSWETSLTFLLWAAWHLLPWAGSPAALPPPELTHRSRVWVGHLTQLGWGLGDKSPPSLDEVPDTLLGLIWLHRPHLSV